jgi:tRNA G18 (ribose-2'-O)-methylase SpoU
MRKVILVLPNIRSTHNVGAILRTCEGMGVEKVIFSGYTPYPELDNDSRLPHETKKLTSRITKTALGAEKILNMEYVQDLLPKLKNLKVTGYSIASLEQAKSSIPLNKYKSQEKIVLILGNELDGVEDKILDISDVILEIPMQGKKESYNVASAAAIALYKLILEN